jgi:citrate lyase subunit beta/citryl-CoA lyase
MPVVTDALSIAPGAVSDFINLDLEDSVPQHLKAYARNLIKDAIPNVSKGGAEVFTRINHDYILADLEAIVWPGLSRVNYPKAEYGAEIRKLDEIITRLERERGIRPGTVEIGANIETAVGVANGYEIVSASPRVQDFGGCPVTTCRVIWAWRCSWASTSFVYGKGECELIARTLEVETLASPFVANTTGSVSDSNLAFRQAEAARKCGFRHGGGLNPAVVEPQNRGFTPSEEDVRDAHWVLEQYRQLAGSGDTWREVNGRIIDRYEAARARDTLEWAELCAERNREKAEAVARVQAAMAEHTSQASA